MTEDFLHYLKDKATEGEDGSGGGAELGEELLDTPETSQNQENVFDYAKNEV